MKRSTRTPRKLAVTCIACGMVALPVGCVPLGTHRDTKDKLAQTQLANQDLVRDLNIAQRRLAALEAQSKDAVSPAERNRLQAEVAMLREQLARRPTDGLPFPEKVIDDAGAESERGGMRLGEALLFNPGVAELKSAQLPILDRIAGILKTQYPNETFIIEGHTDNQPLKSTLRLHEDNSNLGYKRARAVFKYLRDRGIKEDQMIVQSFGYLRPIVPGEMDTEEGRRRNRRVVLRRAKAKI